MTFFAPRTVTPNDVTDDIPRIYKKQAVQGCKNENAKRNDARCRLQVAIDLTQMPSNNNRGRSELEIETEIVRPAAQQLCARSIMYVAAAGKEGRGFTVDSS